MKNATLLFSLLASAMLTSCAGISPTRIISNTVGTAGGALIGHKFSGGDPLVATASAGAGVLLSESLQAGSNASAQKSYDAGMTKHEAILRSSNSNHSTSGSLSDRSPMTAQACASSKCRCPNGRRTASSSRRAP